MNTSTIAPADASLSAKPPQTLQPNAAGRVTDKDYGRLRVLMAEDNLVNQVSLTRTVFS
jgi:hypothetical protein